MPRLITRVPLPSGLGVAFDDIAQVGDLGQWQVALPVHAEVVLVLDVDASGEIAHQGDGAVDDAGDRQVDRPSERGPAPMAAGSRPPKRIPAGWRPAAGWRPYFVELVITADDQGRPGCLLRRHAPEVLMVFSIGSWKPSPGAAMALVLGVSTRRPLGGAAAALSRGGRLRPSRCCGVSELSLQTISFSPELASVELQEPLPPMEPLSVHGTEIQAEAGEDLAVRAILS